MTKLNSIISLLIVFSIGTAARADENSVATSAASLATISGTVHASSNSAGQLMALRLIRNNGDSIQVRLDSHSRSLAKVFVGKQVKAIGHLKSALDEEGREVSWFELKGYEAIARPAPPKSGTEIVLGAPWVAYHM